MPPALPPYGSADVSILVARAYNKHVSDAKIYYTGRIADLNLARLSTRNLHPVSESRLGWDAWVVKMIEKIEEAWRLHLETLTRRKNDGTLLRMRLRYSEVGIEGAED